MDIRVATLADLVGVLNIDTNVRKGDASRGQWLESRVADGQVLVGSADGRVVGYVVAEDGDFFDRAFVHLLFVTESRRRTGAASTLLDAAVVRAASDRVFTSTNRSNDPMLQLMGKLGWTEAGTVDGLDDGDPEVFFYIDKA